MDYIGLRCTYDDFDLRRELLLFDRLALPLLETTLDTWRNRDWSDPQKGEKWRRTAAELQWLAEKEVVFAPSTNSLEYGAGPEAEDYRQYMLLQIQVVQDLSPFHHYTETKKLQVRSGYEMAKAVYLYMTETGDVDVLKRMDELSRVSYDSLSRALAVEISKNPETLALPILSSKSHYEAATSARTDVLNIALRAVPFPAPTTSLERILEFRSDPDVRADFLAFHRWTSSIAKIGAQPAEILEEIEYLLAQYQRHMRLHEIEHSSGAFETVVTIGAEALEGIIKFNWGEVAKLLFSFRKRKAALLKAEMSAPGRELAYLVKAGSVSEAN